jgi:ribokinase
VDVVYISSLSNESADAFPDIVAQAKAQKALVATNPRVRQLSSRGGAFQESLAHIDILAVNRSEADVLVPRLVARFGEGGSPLKLDRGETAPQLAIRGFAGGGHEMSLTAFFRALRELGPRYVVVTDGRHGAFLGSPEAIMYCPVVEARVAGTAGAGDAFNSTFTAYVALGSPPEDALRAAAINSAAVVGHVDTQSGLLTRDEINSRLAREMDKLNVRIWSQ